MTHYSAMIAKLSPIDSAVALEQRNAGKCCGEGGGWGGGGSGTGGSAKVQLGQFFRFVLRFSQARSRNSALLLLS